MTDFENYLAILKHAGVDNYQIHYGDGYTSVYIDGDEGDDISIHFLFKEDTGECFQFYY